MRGDSFERRVVPYVLTERWGWGALAALAAMLLLVACESPATDVTGATDARLAASSARTTPTPAAYDIGSIQRAVPRPCPAPEQREFDFWLGTWRATNPETGKLRFLSEITSELGGCVVMESTTAPNGFRSRSMSAYDDDTDTWHQSFLSANTTNIRMSGGLVGSDMVLEADQLAFDVVTRTVKRREHTVTWAPRPDGTVTQTVEVKFDGEPRPTVVSLLEPVPGIDPPAPLPLPICDAVPGFRDLDFWAGEWRVVAADGPALGRSEVAIDLSGCLVEESFVGPNGYESRSFVFYDFVIGTWFRTFADRNGEYITLRGAVEDDDDGVALVMTGQDHVPDYGVVDLRVTLRPSPDGVVQVWEQSDDGGESWRTTLTLEYRPTR